MCSKSADHNWFVFLGLLFVCGCGGAAESGSPPSVLIPTADQTATTNVMDAASRAVDSRITGDDRNLLLTVARSRGADMPLPQYTDLIAVAITDQNGNVTRTISNHYGDSSLQINRFDGSPSATSSVTSDELSLQSNLPPPNPTQHAGSGPYHQVWSDNVPGNQSVSSGVTIPCNATINDFANGKISGSPYVYDTFRNPSDSSPIEGGLQFNIATGTKPGMVQASNLQPYIRIDIPHMKYFCSPGASCVAPSAIYHPVYRGSFGNGTEFACPNNASIAVSMSTFLTLGYYQTGYGLIIVNSELQNTGAYINWAVYFPADKNATSSTLASYLGYVPNACVGCRAGWTTSIAQNFQDNKNNGDFFGPVIWSVGNIKTPQPGMNPVNFDQCIDYPGWTTNPNNECGSTPNSPLNTVISVGGQSQVPEHLGESVSIDNKAGSWTH